MGTSSPMRYQPADRPVRSVFRHLSLLQRGWLVLGSDLNCSESAWAAAGPAPQRITRQRETCSTADFGPLFVRFGASAEFACDSGTSGLHSKADELERSLQVRFVPKGDIRIAAKAVTRSYHFLRPGSEPPHDA